MFKFLCLFVVSALLIEASPVPLELAEAAKNGNWDVFNTLLRQYTQNNNWATALAGNVESLQPDGKSHVFGHAVSAYKEWHNDNGKVTEDGRGVEVINNDGHVIKHEFKP
ncbi:uncharacterized protein LOC113401088 [Vanessa tameamea]|uniref:Uncharacterized protein LOC113401088 n=1 Tax=Vanessa tameamea TaxID=334116 RepID=A0A8B8IHP1_VANTA|nr:uncharacterized protein LOC113401088 isoform X2 [Vanessa tameamea]